MQFGDNPLNLLGSAALGALLLEGRRNEDEDEEDAYLRAAMRATRAANAAASLAEELDKVEASRPTRATLTEARLLAAKLAGLAREAQDALADAEEAAEVLIPAYEEARRRLRKLPLAEYESVFGRPEAKIEALERAVIDTKGPAEGAERAVDVCRAHLRTVSVVRDRADELAGDIQDAVEGGEPPSSPRSPSPPQARPRRGAAAKAQAVFAAAATAAEEEDEDDDEPEEEKRAAPAARRGGRRKSNSPPSPASAAAASGSQKRGGRSWSPRGRGRR